MQPNHFSRIFTVGLIVTQLQACGRDARLQLVQAQSIAKLSSTDDLSPSERVDAAYAAAGDRFRIKCHLSLSGGVDVDDSAILSSQRPTAVLNLRPYLLKIAVNYPSLAEASQQATPAPFLYYSYEVIRGHDVLAKHEQQRSYAHVLPLEIPEELGEHGCLLLPQASDPIPFPKKPYSLVHINVHPHRTFDPTGLLSGQIEPLLKDPTIKSFILLEAQKLPSNLSALLPAVPQATYPFWDPKQSFALKDLGAATLVVAPQGEFKWEESIGGEFPSMVLMTGGFFKACLTRQLAFLNAAFSRSKATLLNLIYVDQWILRHPGDDLDQPSELGGIPSAPEEARVEGEKTFLHLLGAFNKSYNLDDTGLEYRFSYSVLRKNKVGQCDPHAAAIHSEQGKCGNSSKKVVVFNMVQCL